MKDGIVRTYPSLDKHIPIDVAIVGAGISGALAAYYLRHSDLSVAVFDRRHVGMGSTAASTAFLQYEVDVPMTRLVKYVGENNAVKSYELCRKAIYDIEAICKKLKPEFDFHLRPSLQYASFKKHKDDLYEEYKMRKKHGFEVDWLGKEDVKKNFGFEAPGGIFSKDGGEVDAYLLTHALLADFCKHGHKVFNNTDVKNIRYSKGRILLKTGAGMTVKAKHLIIVCGYESQRYLPKQFGTIHSTYALVTEPVDKQLLWHKNSLIWETAEPYTYFRIVGGDRILIGGKDDPFYDPALRDSRIKRKAGMLVNAFNKVMQNIPVKPDFSWAGAFSVTKDGLPYIGKIPKFKNTYFALGYGGNGITFSVIAAEVIRDSLLKKKNANEHLFSFNR
jgi:glycine/D-amino acid oxidase-like deaminating enzyme